MSRSHYLLPAGGGNLTKMFLEKVDIDEPCHGQLQIRVMAIGLNVGHILMYQNCIVMSKL